eukprot:7306715-Prymnesium_polylepis.1
MLQSSLDIFRALPFQALPDSKSESDMRVLAELHHRMGFIHRRSPAGPTPSDGALHFAEALRLLAPTSTTRNSYLKDLVRYNIHLAEALDEDGRRPPFAKALYKLGLDCSKKIVGNSQDEFVYKHVRERLLEIDLNALPPPGAAPPGELNLTQQLPFGLGSQPLFHPIDHPLSL